MRLCESCQARVTNHTRCVVCEAPPIPKPRVTPAMVRRLRDRFYSYSRSAEFREWAREEIKDWATRENKRTK